MARRTLRKFLAFEELASNRVGSLKQSVRKRGFTKALIRAGTAQSLRISRKEDLKRTGGRWNVSFDAGLTQLNTFFRADLIKEAKSAFKSTGSGVKHVVDIGCGTGRGAVEFAQKIGPGVRVSATGTKILPDWQSHIGHESVDFKVAHGQNLSKRFAPGSVDFIFSNLGIMHSQVTRHSLVECYKILKKHGRLVLTISVERLHQKDLNYTGLFKEYKTHQFVFFGDASLVSFFLEKR
ncbi:MAG: class I SAM-dependent methyltransferase [archaeon]|jgi:SAM-dependent methyltransferase